MSTTSSIAASTATDSSGNSYTTSISNDSLTSEDFITLMLTELSQQDPTDPVDSSSMMDSQLQLSTLEANLATVDAMESLQASYEKTALSTASSLIGNTVETGETDDSGNLKEYKISSASSSDGTITLTGYQLTGYYDVYYFDETSSGSDVVSSSSSDDSISITDSDGTSHTYSTYNKTYDELASEISLTDGITASMVQNSSGNYQLMVSLANGNSSISQNNTKLSYSTDTATSYSSEAESILFDNITKIY